MAQLVPYVRPAAPSRLVSPADLADLEPVERSIIEGEYVEAYPGVNPVWHILVIVALQAAGLVAIAVWAVAR